NFVVGERSAADTVCVMSPSGWCRDVYSRGGAAMPHPPCSIPDGEGLSALLQPAERVDDLHLGGVGNARIGMEDDLDLLRTAVTVLVASQTADQSLEGRGLERIAQGLAAVAERAVVVLHNHLVDGHQENDGCVVRVGPEG